VYYKRKHKEGTDEGAFLPVTIFLLFILQVDTFVYLDSLGALMFSLLVSRVAITYTSKMKEEIKLPRGMKLTNYEYIDKTLVYGG
jgi:hypothetical protein